MTATNGRGRSAPPAAPAAPEPPGAAADVAGIGRTPAPGEVVLCSLSLAPEPAALARFEASLGADELARADRFRAPKDRRRYVAARGALRAILAGCLGLEARALRFAYGPHGKPALVEPDADLGFNLAHAGDRALVAVARGRTTGVDLEAIPDARAVAALMDAALTDRERSSLRAAPPAERPHRIAGLWTRKEALAKAVGLGLALPFATIEASTADDPASWFGWERRFVAGREWSLRSLDVGPEFAAALAIDGEPAPIRWDRAVPDFDGSEQTCGRCRAAQRAWPCAGESTAAAPSAKASAHVGAADHPENRCTAIVRALRPPRAVP